MIIYSNMEEDIFSKENIDEVREFLFDCYGEAMNYETAEDVEDDIIAEKITEMSNREWDELRSELSDMFGCEMVWKGHCSSWKTQYLNGGVEPDGYMMTDSLNEVSTKLLRNCEQIRISDEGGRLIVEGIHHDGRLYAEGRELNEKGKTKLERGWYFCEDQYETYEKIFGKSTYSRRPMFAKKLGWDTPAKAA